MAPNLNPLKDKEWIQYRLTNKSEKENVKFKNILYFIITYRPYNLTIVSIQFSVF